MENNALELTQSCCSLRQHGTFLFVGSFLPRRAKKNLQRVQNQFQVICRHRPSRSAIINSDSGPASASACAAAASASSDIGSIKIDSECGRITPRYQCLA